MVALTLAKFDNGGIECDDANNSSAPHLASCVLDRCEIKLASLEIMPMAALALDGFNNGGIEYNNTDEEEVFKSPLLCSLEGVAIVDNNVVVRRWWWSKW